MTAPATYAHPIPIRPASRRVISEPSTPPTAAAPRTSPSSPGRTCRDRVAYSTNRAANTKSKKLMTDAEMRAARTIGEPRMNRAPADSASSPPFVAGASLGLIRCRKNAEPRKDKASAAIASGALSACTSRPPRLGPPTKEKARLAYTSDVPSTYLPAGMMVTETEPSQAVNRVLAIPAPNATPYSWASVSTFSA